MLTKETAKAPPTGPSVGPSVGRSVGPAYLRLSRSGELGERARLARARLADCDLCARARRYDPQTRTPGP